MTSCLTTRATSAGRKSAYTSIQASPRRPWKVSRWSRVATRSRVATTAIVGIGIRARAQSGWRAAQNEITAADQKPAPTKAALSGGSIVHEKNSAVCSARTKSWVPAKKVNPVST
jgi:hypothetical protein